MTVSAPVERPRILARLAEQPGQTAYEIAAALGYGKPESHRVAHIVRQLHQAGLLLAGSEFRPLMGRTASVYRLAPPGTPPLPRREESPAAAEARRRRHRIARQRQRARRAGKPVTAELVARPGVHLPGPPAWDLPGDPACQAADPSLFFGEEDEGPQSRAQRVTAARAVCSACPVRRCCLDGAVARGERFGVWAGVDLETERPERSTQTTRPAAADRA